MRVATHATGPRTAMSAAEPAAHEELPAVHRAVEVRVERHRQVPRQHRPSRTRSRIDDEHGEPPLQRVRAVQLAPLLAEAGAHPRADPRRPLRAALRQHADVEADATCQTYHSCSTASSAEDHDVARRSGTRGRDRPPSRRARRAVRPREDVAAPTNRISSRKHERDRQERDVALREADDAARPARRRDALHGDEHHAAGRDRGEEQPVHVERVPGAVDADRTTPTTKMSDADDRAARARRRERLRQRLFDAAITTLARTSGEVQCVTSVLMACLSSVASVGALRAAGRRPAAAGQSADDTAPAASGPAASRRERGAGLARAAGDVSAAIAGILPCSPRSSSRRPSDPILRCGCTSA